MAISKNDSPDKTDTGFYDTMHECVQLTLQKDDGKSPKRQKRIVFATLMIMCVFVVAEIILTPLIPFLLHDSKSNMSVNSLSAM